MYVWIEADEVLELDFGSIVQEARVYFSQINDVLSYGEELN